MAAMLLIAAWLKAGVPSRAAGELAWTGLEFDVRVNLVDVLSLVEAVIGAGLLFFGASTAVHAVGICGAFLLVCMHAYGMLGERSSCGCFGEVNVQVA